MKYFFLVKQFFASAKNLLESPIFFNFSFKFNIMDFLKFVFYVKAGRKTF